jgi:hypothetical protein
MRAEQQDEVLQREVNTSSHERRGNGKKTDLEIET